MQKSQENIRRQAWEENAGNEFSKQNFSHTNYIFAEDLDVKTFVVAELSRKLAENDKRGICAIIMEHKKL